MLWYKKICTDICECEINWSTGQGISPLEACVMSLMRVIPVTSFPKLNKMTQHDGAYLAHNPFFHTHYSPSQACISCHNPSCHHHDLCDCHQTSLVCGQSILFCDPWNCLLSCGLGAWSFLCAVCCGQIFLLAILVALAVPCCSAEMHRIMLKEYKFQWWVATIRVSSDSYSNVNIESPRLAEVSIYGTLLMEFIIGCYLEMFTTHGRRQLLWLVTIDSSYIIY